MSKKFEDPYYIAVDTVNTSLKKVNSLFSEVNDASFGTRRRADKSDVKGTILSELRTLDYDIQDLEASIVAVERDPQKFNLDTREVQTRKDFVSSTKVTVRKMRDKLNAMQRAAAEAEAPRRAEVERSNAAFIGSQRQEQQTYMRQQDEQLEELAKSAERLNHTALTINHELEDQQRMLSELDEDVDNTAEKMNFVMKRMAKLLKTNDTRQLCLILLLVLILVLLFLLVLYT
ncbi:unnamed protein product [Vitrella brassicaformis CCMP3155]|uniref:t-SNARE coiled-coil homology domain-containing protein n=1 Tax=Vitrella brassicaformis (strain CCMP3155) TaxID=1169540 RepID=A0A0G4G3N1_VITBC|nr:unnamed protein product [Vitrella brassicaformis CCMP3155]|mmetsp:Transcript_36939/g.92642  ORF Transcript_36939/g.92642 Transcript_36939/m.92642 type:complete len:232 (-) Transcript_36939:903-1598(-)|eukprot:CEM22868.1 unnamed protein product [Vitrella brassicaformis CCMP3155]